MTRTTTYSLYLESGPRQQKTMVHAPELLGCIAQGATTQAALDATPDAIRAYLRFLKRHGEAVKPENKFSTHVVAHIMEGSWLGNGDPTPGFVFDFEPLTTRDLAIHLQHWDWMHTDLLQLVRDTSRKQQSAEPAKGRSLSRILEHIAESDGVYLRYLVGKDEALAAALAAFRKHPDDQIHTLEDVWRVEIARLQKLTTSDRQAKVQHGQVAWTARRCLRRMLEHDWEHLLEIAERFDQRQH